MPVRRRSMDMPPVSRLLDGLTRLLAAVPAAQVPRTGRFLGRLIALADIPHRRIVRRNLRFSHPRWSAGRIRRMTREVYEHLGITMLEICRLPRISAGEIRQGVTLAGRRVPGCRL
jgi:lauroyl/myristoyl acyltransferase